MATKRTKEQNADFVPGHKSGKVLLFRLVEKRFGRIKATLAPERGAGKRAIWRTLTRMRILAQSLGLSFLPAKLCILYF
jgi:hypothetical protein